MVMVVVPTWFGSNTKKLPLTMAAITTVLFVFCVIVYVKSSPFVSVNAVSKFIVVFPSEMSAVLFSSGKSPFIGQEFGSGSTVILSVLSKVQVPSFA